MPFAAPIENAKGNGAAEASDDDAEQPELMLQADPVDAEDRENEQANGSENAESAAATSDDDTPATGDDRARSPLRLNAMLSNVYMNASIHFDENGVERNRSESMYINLSIHPPEGVEAIQYRIKKYHDMVTTTGEKISLSEHHHHSLNRWQDFSRHHHGNNRQLRMSVSLNRPRIPAQRIKRVAADVELKVSEGPKMRVELSPIEKYFDRDIRIKNIKDCRIRIERKAPDRLRVEYRGDGWENLDDVSFYNAQGNKINSHGWSSSTRDWGYYREYHLTMPEGGKAVFDIWRDVRVRPGRFEVEDVPLPGQPSPQDQVDVSQREHDADAVRA
ncbi:MAG: hypothetical protein ACOC1G_04590 [Phycisphaeraceae bacterium]